MIDLATGILLISDPFLKDPNFLRTVILLCEHNDNGSLGFVLNKTIEPTIGELVEALEGCDFPVYQGGPVALNSVFFLHQRSDLIDDGIHVTDNIYWGGNFEQLTALIKQKQLTKNDVRFFVGYSGWDAEQLQGELDEKSWIMREASSNLIFNRDINLVWKEALKDLGGEYAQMRNYPIDPQLN